MNAQRDRVLTFFSDFRFLLNKRTEPNNKYGKVISVIFVKKKYSYLLMNTDPSQHTHTLTYFDK